MRLKRGREQNQEEDKYFIKDEPIIQISNDKFGHSDIAKNIVNIIKSHNAPYNIALIGKWGIGKSSILELVKSELNNQKKYKFHELNVWKYEKEAIRRALTKKIFESVLNPKKKEELKKEFYDSIHTSSISETKDEKGILEKIKQIGKEVIVRNIGLLLAFIFIVVMLSIMVWLFTGQSINFIDIIISVGTIILVTIMSSSVIGNVIEKCLTMDFNKTKTTIELPIKDADEYENLLKKGLEEIKHKEIIIVDDLDRLSTAKIVEALDAIKAFAELKQIIIIVPFDDDILRQALNKRTESFENNKFIIENELFLDKLFQFKIYIPPIPNFEIKGMIKNLCDDECKKMNEICGEDFEEIISILIHPAVKTPRHVKKNINTFMNNMLIFKNRDGNRLEEGISEKIESKRILAKLSVLQSDYNDFYEMLVKDFNIIDNFIDTYNNKEKSNKDIHESLKEFYHDIKLKSEWESLANFLIYSIDIEIKDYGTYIYLTQDKVGRIIGDEKQNKILEVIYSRNIIKLEQLIEEDSQNVELVINNLLNDNNIDLENIITIIEVITKFEKEFAKSQVNLIVKKLYNKILSKAEMKYEKYKIENIVYIYENSNERDKIESFVKNIILNIREKISTAETIKENEFIETRLKGLLSHNEIWSIEIKRSIQEIINYIVYEKNKYSNILFYRSDIMKEPNILEYIDMEIYRKIFEDINKQDLEDKDFIEVVIKIANKLIKEDKYEDVVKDFFKYINNPTLLNTIIEILKLVKQNKKGIKIEICNNIIISVELETIQKNGTEIKEIIEILEFKITEENKKKYDEILSELEKKYDIHSIVEKLSNTEEIKSLNILSTQINKNILTYNMDIIKKLISSYNEKQLTELYSVISDTITKYSSVKVEKLEMIVSIFNLIIKDDRKREEIYKDINLCATQFNSYYNMVEWARIIMGFLAKNINILETSQRQRYINNLKSILKTTEKENVISAISIINKEFKKEEKEELLKEIIENNEIFIYKYLRTIKELYSGEISLEIKNLFINKIITEINNENITEINEILRREVEYINSNEYINSIKELRREALTEATEIIALMYNAQNEENKLKIVIEILNNIIDIEKLRFIISKIEITNEIIEKIKIEELDEYIEIDKNLLTIMQEKEVNKKVVIEYLKEILKYIEEKDNIDDEYDRLEMVLDIKKEYYPVRIEKKEIAEILVKIFNATSNSSVKDKIYEIVNKLKIKIQFESFKLDKQV